MYRRSEYINIKYQVAEAIVQLISVINFELSHGGERAHLSD